MFLTSKPVMQIQRAFDLVIKAESVKVGEQILNQLRASKQFPLLIANYISSSVNVDKHCKILAILEIKKIVHTLDDAPENQSIWWHLYQQYYKSQDTISNLILDVILKNSNSYPIFLNIDCKNFSLIQNFRALQIISNIFQQNEYKSQDFWEDHLMHIEYALVNLLQFGDRQLVCLTATMVNVFMNLVIQCNFKISDVWKQVLKMALKDAQPTSELILKFLQYKVMNILSDKDSFDQFSCTYSQFCQCLRQILQQKSLQVQGIKVLTQIFQYLPINHHISEILQVLHKHAYEQISRNTDQQLIAYIETELSKDQYPLSFIRPLAKIIVNKICINFERQYKSQSQLSKMTELYIVFLISFCPRIQTSHLHSYQSILSGLLNYLVNQRLENRKKKQIKFQIFIIIKSLEGIIYQISAQTIFYVFQSISAMAKKYIDLGQICYHFLNEKIDIILQNMVKFPEKMVKFFKQHVYNINRSQWTVTVSTFQAPLLIIMNMEDISQILDDQCFKMFDFLLELLNEPNQMNHQISFLLIDVIEKVYSHLRVQRKQQKLSKKFINQLYKLINLYQLWSSSATQIYLIKMINQGAVLDFLTDQLSEQYFWITLEKQKLQFNLILASKILKQSKKSIAQEQLRPLVNKILQMISHRKDWDKIITDNYQIFKFGEIGSNPSKITKSILEIQ